MGIYDVLGIRPIVNAAGPVTRLSGGPAHPDVAAAMAEAAQSCVRIDDLQEAAGRYLAEVTGAEAGYVTSGAAAGLAIGAAACVAGLDVAAMDQLPDTTGLRNEIIVQRAHMNAYAHALRVCGARLVEVGYLGYPGQGITWPWQVEAAITERTAAIACAAGNDAGTVPIDELARIAKGHDVAVIVDAAGALPPAENLKRFIAAGADLVAFSGGKAIGGPQASGILVGRADLIESVALQHQDMDVYPETWTWRERYIESGRLPGPPHHGMGRPMKVGKEEVVGLVVALRRFLECDHAAERRAQEDRLLAIRDAVDGVPGVSASLLDDSASPRPYPTLLISVNEKVVERTVEELINDLMEHEQPVGASQNFLHLRAIGIVASSMKPGEERIVAERLREIFR